MLQDELESVKSGIGVVGLISTLLVALVLFGGLRSWRLAVPILVTLVAGLTWTAGFAALAVGELNIISVAFAVLFIGLSVRSEEHTSELQSLMRISYALFCFQ